MRVALVAPLLASLLCAQEGSQETYGHSRHGATFDEGPRSAAYLMPGMGDAVHFPVEGVSELGQKFFDLEREHLELQQKYLKRISDAVSPVIAVQFIQLQRQFETELAMERMKYSPLAE